MHAEPTRHSARVQRANVLKSIVLLNTTPGTKTLHGDVCALLPTNHRGFVNTLTEGVTKLRVVPEAIPRPPPRAMTRFGSGNVGAVAVNSRSIWPRFSTAPGFVVAYRPIWRIGET